MTVADARREADENDIATRAYGEFGRQRTRLAELFVRVERSFEELSLESRARRLAKLRKKVESAELRVMIMGEFKRGKSTLINAILGHRVLPAKAVPCTATINEITWGEEEHVVLHFRSPRPESLAQEVPREIREHLERHSDPPPPLEVEAGELRRYIAIADPAKEQEESVALTPYERVQLFWPVELCRNGVQIIDSPGLNEHGVRNRIVRGYLGEADAVVFVLKSDALASSSELDVIDERIRGNGHEEIFFVCNAFDRIPKGERDEVRDVGLGKLAHRTAFGPSGVFFLSALEALEGRLDADPERVAASGLPVFEERLAHFLTRDRGRAKLLQPARHLRSVSSEVLRAIVPEQRKSLDDELLVIERRRMDLEPKLAAARKEKDRIVDSFETALALLGREVREAAAELFEELPQAFGAWLNKLEPETKIRVKAIHRKKQLEDLVNELSRRTEAWFEDRCSEWERERLQPLVRKRLESALKNVKRSLDVFGEMLDGFRSEIGLGVDETSSTASRMAFVFEGLQAGVFAGWITFGLAAGVLGITSLWILAPLLLGAGALGFWSGGEVYIHTVKKKFQAQVLKHLRENEESLIEKAVDEMQTGGRELLENVDRALSEEIESVREELDAVLREKRMGEEKAAARRELLDRVESEIRAVETSLDDLVFTIAETA